MDESGCRPLHGGDLRLLLAEGSCQLLQAFAAALLGFQPLAQVAGANAVYQIQDHAGNDHDEYCGGAAAAGGIHVVAVAAFLGAHVLDDHGVAFAVAGVEGGGHVILGKERVEVQCEHRQDAGQYDGQLYLHEGPEAAGTKVAGGVLQLLVDSVEGRLDHS